LHFRLTACRDRATGLDGRIRMHLPAMRVMIAKFVIRAAESHRIITANRHIAGTFIRPGVNALFNDP
jgi:hypothetical protein